MTSIFMIFILATTALAKETIECNFLEPTGPRRCSGAVGQPLILHLTDTVNPDIVLKKDNKHVILKVKNHSVTMKENNESFTDGILKLGKATQRHSGDYLLEEFGSDGSLLREIKVQLKIIASVSKPAVSQMCLSPDQMNISCSSEGDAVEFTLTLDGHSLMQTEGRSLSQSSGTINRQTEDRSGSSTSVTISLYGQLTGRLMCRVGNNVSRDEAVVHLTSCGEVSSFSVVTVAVTAGVVSLLLVILCLWIKRLRNQPRPTTVDEGDGEVEIIYSDVRVTRKPPNASEQHRLSQT